MDKTEETNLETKPEETKPEETEADFEFDSKEPVFLAMTAQEVVNEALAHLMDRACDQTPAGTPQGEYPDEEEMDRLAPSLKAGVMREIREQELTPCNHAWSQMADLAYDVVAGLPEAEVDAMVHRMKPEDQR